MASFSDRLKAATQNSGIAMAAGTSNMVSEPSIMTLEETPYDGLAYSGETWTLNGRYKATDNNALGKRYEDENISYVDDKKNVKINEYQVNLTQEENSQYIPFEMFRYYDGVDLMDTSMKITVFFVNKDGDYGESEVINVRYNDTKIRFGFLVPVEATVIAGKLRFEIHVTGVSPLGGRYLLKTKPNDELIILESLQGNGNIIIDENWATSVLEEVKQAEENAYYYSSQAQSYANQALSSNAQTKNDINTALADMQKMIDDSSATIEENVKKDLERYIDGELEPYITEQEVNALIGNERFGNDINGNTITNVVDYVNNAMELVDISDKLGSLTDNEGKELTVEQYVKQEVDSVDVTEQLKDYAKSADVYTKTETYTKGEVDTAIETSKEGYATETFVTEKIAQEDITGKLGNYYTKGEVDTAIENAEPDLTGVATEEYVDGKIQTVNSAIATINQTLDTIDKSPNKTYEAIYNDESVGENVFQLVEIVNEGKENEERVVKSQFTIVGGSGGSSSANSIKIDRITNSPLVVTANDKVEIEYRFTGTDSSGDDIGQGNVTWMLGNKVIKTETVYTGVNKTDLTEYLSVASDQKLTLIISDDIGTRQQKTWYVSVVDVKLESNFDDTRKYTANSPVVFTYTPYGAVDKTVHYLLDGKEIGTKTSAKGAAGLSDSFSIPAKSHGTHLFEIYMTATINNNDIESNHIVKDIIWYDETSNVPVIGTVQQKFTARQYEATNITYTVYDPSTETPNVTLRATYVNEDGETVETYNSSLTMSSNTDVWQFKTDVMGEHTLTIICGETVKTLKATIVDLGINVSPTTAGLEFDFNPVGYSNNDANRLWKDNNTEVAMTVSDNFDWVNGGYQIDENGDQYFCVKAGTTATINYNLFADDAKDVGKEFKAIFKTSNVKKRDASFISCMNGGIGLDMKVESANIYSSNGSLYSPYCEEDVIEFEFNINKSVDIPLVLTYEDGVGNRPMIYTSDSSFWQTEPQPITIGCNECDVHIYRMKAYSTSLSDKDILNNFIADARSAEEMIARYKRNQIYKDGLLNPEYLAEVCPDLRIIMVDAPWFTNDKDNKIDDTNITMIYKNGDPILDNWTCTGARHRGRTTCPLYMETYIYEARKKTGMLKRKSEWKAMFKSIVTCNAY